MNSNWRNYGHGPVIFQRSRVGQNGLVLMGNNDELAEWNLANLGEISRGYSELSSDSEYIKIVSLGCFIFEPHFGLFLLFNELFKGFFEWTPWDKGRKSWRNWGITMVTSQFEETFKLSESWINFDQNHLHVIWISILYVIWGEIGSIDGGFWFA